MDNLLVWRLISWKCEWTDVINLLMTCSTYNRLFDNEYWRIRCNQDHIENLTESSSNEALLNQSSWKRNYWRMEFLNHRTIYANFARLNNPEIKSEEINLSLGELISDHKRRQIFFQTLFKKYQERSRGINESTIHSMKTLLDQLFTINLIDLPPELKTSEQPLSSLMIQNILLIIYRLPYSEWQKEAESYVNLFQNLLAQSQNKAESYLGLFQNLLAQFQNKL